MKSTNLEKAAKWGYYQLHNLPAEALNDQWFKDKHMNSDSFTAPDLPDYFKTCKYEIGYFAEVRAQKNAFTGAVELWYIDSKAFLLFSDSLDFPVMLRKDSRTNKYSFYPIYPLVNRLQANSNYRVREKFVKEVKEPNMIGIFTDKKVSDWVNYCREYITALENASNSIEKKKADNLSKIESIIESLPGCKVTRGTGRTWIETKLFEITFELQESGTYLKQEIKFKGNLDDIVKNQL